MGLAREVIEAYKNEGKKNIKDEDNPKYAFQALSLSLLTMIASKKVDCIELAINELNERGYDKSGKYVGFYKPKPIK